MYAEEKEEEVKILEHSVEELECTINVLEKKVCSNALSSFHLMCKCYSSMFNVVFLEGIHAR